MKKVLHINLGSYPFTIDIDAYEMLDNYFLSLEKHFKNNDNPDEIIQDIEARMAELFHENAGQHSILNTKDVAAAIKIMGKPGDFGDEEQVESTEKAEEKATGKKKKGSYQYRTGRKLFRDPDNKVISGLCSGLSAYFGIADPVWMRIIVFILGFMSAGTVLIAYFILTLIIPKALTSADRKAMLGEPIDINVVAESVEEELGGFSDQIQDWAQDFRSKRKGRKQRKYRRKRKY